MSISGRCSCGAVTYECSATPVVQGNCHCSECQRMTGSAYSATLYVPESSVKINGDVKYFTRPGGSGNLVERGFCPVCGSQLFGKPSLVPGLIGLRAGSLDDPSDYRPQVDIFASGAAPWDHMNPSIAKFAESPPQS